MIIAIDGPSGTGKSTVARGVAQKLSFLFFDTGAMYRSLAWWLLQQHVDLGDIQAIEEKLPQFRYEIKTATGDRKYFVDGIDVTHAIRTHEISTASSKIAVFPQVRKTIVQIQRKYGRLGNAVFEGRDMGTVVFPEAEVKIFLTASPAVRAKRRYCELVEKFPDLGETFSLPQILKDIQERDRSDTIRTASPLKQAPDAILIDTSELTAEEVIEQIIRMARSKFHRKSRYQHVFYFCISWITRIYFKLFFRLKIYGLEHFRPGAAIIAANHASNFDPPVVSISCPEEVHFLAKDSLFRKPILGFLIKHLNSHPVSRDAADAHTFRLIISLLQKGEKVILFPEGKRTSDGLLQSIERGLPFLAIKAQCSILPVYIHGTFQAWPKGRAFPKLFGRIICVFGTCIEWDQFERLEKKEAEKKIITRTEYALFSLKAWLENGARGSPP
jgi:cytidylate kinase